MWRGPPSVRPTVMQYEWIGGIRARSFAATGSFIFINDVEKVRNVLKLLMDLVRRCYSSVGFNDLFRSTKSAHWRNI